MPHSETRSRLFITTIRSQIVDEWPLRLASFAFSGLAAEVANPDATAYRSFCHFCRSAVYMELRRQSYVASSH